LDLETIDVRALDLETKHVADEPDVGSLAFQSRAIFVAYCSLSTG
jgi:hypothetical protein